MSRLSVFMPVYNAEAYLREAIDSILNQTYGDFEFIIVEDGSTDKSREILESYTDKRIHLYFNDGNKGVAYTRNRGLELCNTELLAFMDADDIAPLNRFEHEIAYLDKHPEVEGVGGYAQDIDVDGQILNKLYPQYLNPNYIKVNMLFENCIANGSVMIRTRIPKKYQLRFLDNHYGIEDYRFYCEFLQYGTIANLNEIMQQYRIVETSLTIDATKNKKECRDAIIDSIHEFNFDSYGFHFDEEHKNIFMKVFREQGKTETQEELELLYETLQQMVCQAEAMKLQNANMIKTVCRKQFGKQVAKAFWLWETKKEMDFSVEPDFERQLDKAMDLYGNDYTACKESIKDFYQMCEERKLTVALWGAGLKGLAFLKRTDPDGKCISMLVDKDPIKWGKRLPTNHIVNSPEEATKSADVIIVVNSKFYGEVWNLLYSNKKKAILLHLDDIINQVKTTEEFLKSDLYLVVPKEETN